MKKPAANKYAAYATVDYLTRMAETHRNATKLKSLTAAAASMHADSAYLFTVFASVTKSFYAERAKFMAEKLTDLHGKSMLLLTAETDTSIAMTNETISEPAAHTTA